MGNFCSYVKIVKEKEDTSTMFFFLYVCAIGRAGKGEGKFTKVLASFSFYSQSSTYDSS